MSGTLTCLHAKYQMGVLASCSGLKTVSTLQAAKRLGLRPCQVKKIIKSFCKDPDPTSWLNKENRQKLLGSSGIRKADPLVTREMLSGDE